MSPHGDGPPSPHPFGQGWAVTGWLTAQCAKRRARTIFCTVIELELGCHNSSSVLNLYQGMSPPPTCNLFRTARGGGSHVAIHHPATAFLLPIGALPSPSTPLFASQSVATLVTNSGWSPPICNLFRTPRSIQPAARDVKVDGHPSLLFFVQTLAPPQSALAIPGAVTCCLQKQPSPVRPGTLLRWWIPCGHPPSGDCLPSTHRKPCLPPPISVELCVSRFGLVNSLLPLATCSAQPAHHVRPHPQPHGM